MLLWVVMMGRRFRQNLWQILAIVLICLGIFSLIAQVRFAPLVDEIATLAVENKAAGIINQAIDDAIARGDLEYHKIITLEKNANGDISALKTNMAFADAMMKQQKNYGEKAHEWELRIRKRENNNLPVPEEFYETYDYYANK